MPSFCRLELRTIADLQYGPIKHCKFFMKSIFKPSFIILYTGDFSFPYTSCWVLQIRSHMYGIH